MAEQENQQRILTNQSTTTGGPSSRSGNSRSAWSWAVGIVKGSALDFSEEINTVLAWRIKLVSLIFFFAYLAFFLKNQLVGASQMLEAEGLMTFAHLFAMSACGIVAWRLCAGCIHFNRHLRISELIVFGSSEIFFLVITYGMLINAASEGYLYPPVAPWMILIFTYALLIPNSWQRALGMMIPMALGPIVVMLLTGFLSSTVADVFSQPRFQPVFIESLMEMTLTLVIATWGVKTIRSLRAAAFQAQQLGNYRLRRLLGRGGMGEVHLAEHMLLKRPCAIKLIRPEIAGHPETLSRFEREVRSTAQLTHWNTVEIYDYGMSEDGTFYYVMEYLPGMNLDQIVEMHGPLPAERVVHFLKQTCDALDEAHLQGFVHRDIKPANIFAAQRGGMFDVAKLLDFGLVRTEQMQIEPKLTQQGQIAGSPLFMAPEQASGDEIDARCDIYALGCVAYYLLTGKPPFEEKNPVKLILAHAQQVPRKPSELNPNVPRDLEGLVMKCLEKDPSKRFQTVVEFRDALLMTAANGHWTRQSAKLWWAQYGCPKKRELDECVLEGKSLPNQEVSESELFGETHLLVES